jgi:hypothetical protein
MHRVGFKLAHSFERAAPSLAYSIERVGLTPDPQDTPTWN